MAAKQSALYHLLARLINLAAANPGRETAQPLQGGAQVRITISATGERKFVVHRFNAFPETREGTTFFRHWPEALPLPWPTFTRERLVDGYAIIARWAKPGSQAAAQPQPESEPVEHQAALL